VNDEIGNLIRPGTASFMVSSEARGRGVGYLPLD
jgi:hypothetical protein